MPNYNKHARKQSRRQIAVEVNSEPGVPDNEQQNRLAEMAYRYWEARGRPFGSPEEDWFRAEHDYMVMAGR